MSGRSQGRAHAGAGISRRQVLGAGLGWFAAGLWPGRTQAMAATRRVLAFEHLHTGEAVSLAYYVDGKYDERALVAIDHVLRDFRTGEVFPIHRALLDQLHLVQTTLESRAPFQVISGFRSPATNAMLHRSTDGVATRSLHMEGMAIDVRLGDVKTSRLRAAAASLRLGGVGYYPASDFVHLDIGRPRQW